MNISLSGKVSGYYRILVHDAQGQLKSDSGWFSNLITNQGLDWLGAGAPNNNTSGGVPLCTHCGVGTGTSTPAFTDTRLTTFLAMFPSSNSSNVEGNGTQTYVPGPPAYWSCVKTYSFATGAVVGNISEVGVGNCNNTDTNPQLFSHALIVDGSGNPTTISVTGTDALTVNYELRYYINTTDTNYSLSISSTTYSGIYRRATVGSVASLYYQLHGTPSTSTRAVVFTGSIGSITSSPSGGSAVQTSLVAASYTPGTYYRSFTVAWDNTVGGNLSALEFDSSMGSWQFSVSPTIPKTASNTLTLQFNISWARYP